MECAEARKKLKAYAEDGLPADESQQVAGHVETCPVCKKELLLWQQVTEKKTAIKKMQARLPKEMKDRIKYRNASDPDLPPLAKKMRMFNNKGMLITVLVMICGALFFVTRFAPMANRFLSPILIFSGFAILFLLFLFRKPKPPK
jgi:anti-sigma factor ChrR (cupin superfamily)